MTVTGKIYRPERYKYMYTIMLNKVSDYSALGQIQGDIHVDEPTG